jgi:MFS family permease
MALSSGWILGPLILGMLGVEGWSPILGAVGILALAVIPLWLGAAQAPAPEPGMRADLLGVVKEAPVAALAPFIFGAVEIGIFALLPVYAMRQGLSAQQSTYMLTALATGGIALQYPLGWLADRVDRHRILLLCALAGLLGAVSLPLFIHRLPWLLASLVLWGGCVGGLYTVGLTLIGQLFKGPRLAAANTSVVLLYSLGGLIAPAVSGLAMDHWPHTGLALVLGVLCGSYALLTVSMPRRRPESA